MKRLSQHMFSSVFILSMAVLIGWLGLGFFQTASAANSQNHDLITIAAADISAYRWESAPGYYLSHQVWLADLTSLTPSEISAYRWDALGKFYTESGSRDFSSFNAADVSAYRWGALGKFYIESQSRDLSSFNAADVSAYRWGAKAQHYLDVSMKDFSSFTVIDNSDYRFFMVEPGLWTRQTTSLYK